MRGRGSNIVRLRRRWTDGITLLTIVIPLAIFTAVAVWDGVHRGFPAVLDFGQPAAQGSDPRLAFDPLDTRTSVERRSGPITSHVAPLPARDRDSAGFTRCGAFARTNCVIDGDTFWYQGNKIRIADINTPEISSPGCAAEAELGEQASRRLLALLNAGAFSLEGIDRDEDRYGRKLRVVTRDGQSLGDVLVAEGLAEQWQGYRRDWC